MNHYYSLHEDTSGNVAGGRLALVGGVASQACGKTGWQIMNENLMSMMSNNVTERACYV